MDFGDVMALVKEHYEKERLRRQRIAELRTTEKEANAGGSSRLNFIFQIKSEQEALIPASA